MMAPRWGGLWRITPQAWHVEPRSNSPRQTGNRSRSDCASCSSARPSRGVRLREPGDLGRAAAGDWRPLLPQISAPVLVVYGTASLFPPAGCAFVAGAVQRGQARAAGATDLTQQFGAKPTHHRNMQRNGQRSRQDGRQADTPRAPQRVCPSTDLRVGVRRYSRGLQPPAVVGDPHTDTRTQGHRDPRIHGLAPGGV